MYDLICHLLICFCLILLNIRVYKLEDEIFDLKVDLQFREWLEDKINEERQIQK